MQHRPSPPVRKPPQLELVSADLFPWLFRICLQDGQRITLAAVRAVFEALGLSSVTPWTTNCSCGFHRRETEQLAQAEQLAHDYVHAKHYARLCGSPFLAFFGRPESG